MHQVSDAIQGLRLRSFSTTDVNLIHLSGIECSKLQDLESNMCNNRDLELSMDIENCKQHTTPTRNHMDFFLCRRSKISCFMSEDSVWWLIFWWMKRPMRILTHQSKRPIMEWAQRLVAIDSMRKCDSPEALLFHLGAYSALFVTTHHLICYFLVHEAQHIVLFSVWEFDTLSV